MVYFIIGTVLIFNYSIMKMSSRCSRIEEELELNKMIEEKRYNS